MILFFTLYAVAVRLNIGEGQCFGAAEDKPTRNPKASIVKELPKGGDYACRQQQRLDMTGLCETLVWHGEGRE